MSFEVFMQVWCFQKSKLWWKQRKTGEKNQKWSNSHHPILEIVGHISITSRSSFHVYYISFQSLGSQESIGSNGARFGVETKKLWPFEDDYAHHERKCCILLLLDTFFKHYLELKLCILYLFLKLGKSGVFCFKWYTIWRWNEEVMAVWRRLYKAERKCCSHTLFHYCWTRFWSTFWSSNYAYHISF